MAVCYRHPGRETGVSCANCGRPICTDCMTSTSVGMRCPECARQTTKVRRAPSMSSSQPVVTIGLIAINLLIWFGASTSSGSFTTLNGPIQVDYTLAAPFVADGEWYRLVTSGFLHYGIIHVGLNMWVLWVLGNDLGMEAALGRARFLALYLASMLTGSFGALLLSPDRFTAGASGAVFGLMGAAFVMQRARGIDPMQSGIGVTILLNLGISFLIPGISIGGHLGGLVGGAVAAWLMDEVLRRRFPRPVLLSVGACVLVGLVGAAAAIVVATTGGLGLGV